MYTVACLDVHTVYVCMSRRICNIRPYQTHHIQAEAALLVNNVAALGDDAVRVRTASHSALMGAIKVFSTYIS